MKHLCYFASLWLLCPVAGFAGESLVYFGTYTGAQSRGIYVARFDSTTGRLSAPELVAETKNPTFLAVSPGEHFLYVVDETGDAGGKRLVA
jgi:6-phosphogluconolactonase